MAQTAMSSQHALAQIADAYSPALALAALGLIGYQHWRAGKIYSRRAAGCLVAMLLVVYALMGVDRWVRSGGWTGLHYSTHTAFAVALGTFIGGYARRAVALLCISLAAYLTLIVYLGYHSVGDVVLTIILVGPAVFLILRTARTNPSEALPAREG